MYNGGTISSHGLLFDDTDELKCAAEWGVWVWPFRTLEMSNLQHIVILTHTENGFYENKSSLSFCEA